MSEGLLPLRGINAEQADLVLILGCIENGNCVAVGDADDSALEGVGVDAWR